MDAHAVTVADSTARGRPFQFSLRTMLVLTTVLAVVLSGLFAGPAWLTYVTAMALAIAMPMALTVTLIYGRGNVRTFCIGALFPAGALATAFGPGLFFSYYVWAFLETLEDEGAARFIVGSVVGIALVVILVFGLLAIWIRRVVDQQPARRKVEPPSGEDAPTVGAEVADVFSDSPHAASAGHA